MSALAAAAAAATVIVSLHCWSFTEGQELKRWCQRVRLMEAMGPLFITGELDLNANRLDAELEVKKLQQLVWKLEWQNEQLRNRSGGSSGHSLNLLVPGPKWCRPSSGPSLRSESVLGSLQTQEDQPDHYLAGDEPSLLDELELLDLNSLSFSDESDETW